MAKTIVRDRPPEGPPVEFYIAKTHRGQVLSEDHDVYLYPQINGHNKMVDGSPIFVKMGARNTAPKEVVQLLQNAMSMTKQIRSVDQAERNPTSQSMFDTRPIAHEYRPDYEIEILKEG